MDGDAFFTSQIKEMPSFFKACSTGKPVFLSVLHSMDNAFFTISSMEIFFLSSATRSRVASAKIIKILSAIFLTFSLLLLSNLHFCIFRYEIFILIFFVFTCFPKHLSAFSTMIIVFVINNPNTFSHFYNCKKFRIKVSPSGVRTLSG